MPAGLAKVLELLGNSLDVCDPSGILDVNSLEFKGAPGDPAMLIATYKNRDGLFEPAKIQIPGQVGTVDGDNMIFQLPIEEGKYTSYIVGVSGTDKKVIVKTIDTYTDQKNRELARMDREQKGKERLDAMQKEITGRRQKLDAQHQQELEASQQHVRELEKKQAEEEEKEKKEKQPEKENKEND